MATNITYHEESSYELNWFQGYRSLWALIPLTIASATLLVSALLIATIWQNKRFHQPGYYMLVNANLLQLTAAVAYSIIGPILILMYRFSHVPVGGNTILNRVVVFFGDFGYFAGVTALDMISVQRMFAVYFFKHYQMIFTSRTTLLCVCLTWLVGLSVAIPCQTPLCTAYFSPNIAEWAGDYENPYTLAYYDTYFYFPIVSIGLMVVMYAMVGYKLAKNKRKIRPATGAVAGAAAGGGAEVAGREEMKLCVQYIIISLVYAVPLIEYHLVGTIGTGGFTLRQSEALRATRYVMWTVSHCVDTYVHLLVNTSLRRAVADRFGINLLQPRASQVTPGGGSGSAGRPAAPPGGSTNCRF